MTKKEFLEKLDKAIENGWGIKVYVEMPDLAKPELVCNPPENVEQKRNYYDDAYNNEMQLESFTQIKIVNSSFLYLK